MVSPMSGRRTFTATSSPVTSRARWTCAMEAEATGSGSNRAKNCSRGPPSSDSAARSATPASSGGTSSCSRANSRTNSWPSRSDLRLSP